MKSVLKLYAAFFRVGVFTFGGGYAMLPMLEREVVEKHNWATRDQLLDYFAIGQCTPGIIAVNTATFIGYSQRRFLGALFATLGVITPSILIITALAALISNFAHIDAVVHAFAGIRIGVCALILSAVVRLFMSNVIQKGDEGGIKAFFVRNAVPLLIFAAAFTVVALNFSPVYAVIGAAAAGLLLMRGKA